MNRLITICTTLILLTITSLLFNVGTAYAQDPDNPPSPPGITSLEAGEWKVSATSNGYTTWHKNTNSFCSFSDHNYTLDIPADPNAMSDISYTMANWDVDYNDPQGCPGGAEVDYMYFNGQRLGFLTGANNSWSLNTWPLANSQVLSGTNEIYIDTDAPGTGCWCVGVGWIEVRAKVGFQVSAQTPQPDDKNRDFHANNLDLTVTFSDAFQTSTLTNDTFKLEYQDQTGTWQQVSGGFSQLEANKFRFTPGADLKDGVRYRATVKGGPSGIKSQVGAELDSDTVWYFWTVPNLTLTDNFDYGNGNGSVCPPSQAPCPGLEIAIFQVARNVNMVPNKPAVARLYLRWKAHNDVHPNDQVKELQVDVTLKVDGQTLNKRQTLKRPDSYSTAEIQQANHTINIKHTPSSGFTYEAEVIPHPQSNATPVKYSQKLTLSDSGRSPSINFGHYFLLDGAWINGVPPIARAEGINTMTAGTQLTTDMFPVLGTTFLRQGQYTIGYTFTNNVINDKTCGNVFEVSCPLSGNKAEWKCVFEKLETIRGGRKFVAAAIPDHVCPNDTIAMAISDKVLLYEVGTGANGATIAHEVGHIYGISTANQPDDGHRNSNTGIEGFQVRTGTNRSYAEHNNVVSLMHQEEHSANIQWIDNDDYKTLLGNVTSTSLQQTAVISAQSAYFGYLIVSGYVSTDTNTVELIPAFLQDLPNDPPETTGSCVVELLDTAENVLSSASVTPGVDIEFLESNGSSSPRLSNLQANQTAGPQYFTVSLPWNDNAQKLRISCGGTVLLTETRSPNPPAVDFNGLANGTDLSGTQTVSWSGNDADGPNLAYQLQFSNDGSASWTPLMPLGLDTSFDLDTTLLTSGNDMRLRIMVTDGFNTAYAVRSVNIANPPQVLGVLPADAETDVDLNTTVNALFVTDLLPTTLSGAGFQLLENGSTPVNGIVTYNSAGRVAMFTPAARLKANTEYVARLAATVQDINGNSLNTPYEWRFTTGSDTIPPLIIHTSPPGGQVEVPLNALVQARFNKAMDGDTITSDNFQLLDNSNNPIDGIISYNTTTQQSLFVPTADLSPNSNYTVRLTTNVTDLAGNPLESSYEWNFSTGTTKTSGDVRFIGNFNDIASDEDADGFYDNLTLFVDVEVLKAASYNLNARLLDKNDTLIEWQTTDNISLAQGVHTLQLVYSGTALYNNGTDGPYKIDSMHIYNVNNLTLSDRQNRTYQTFPYKLSGFENRAVYLPLILK